MARNRELIDTGSDTRYVRRNKPGTSVRILYDGVANWMAHVAPTAKRGCESFLVDIVASVRQDYDLPMQSLDDATRSLLSGRKSPF